MDNRPILMVPIRREVRERLYRYLDRQPMPPTITDFVSHTIGKALDDAEETEVEARR